MSHATAKATRRDIRRALGPETVSLVNGLTQTLTERVVPTLAHHTDALTEHNRELDSHDRQLDALHERVKALEADARAVKAMTVTQRLRWAMQALF